MAVSCPDSDESFVRSVRKVPVKSLSGKLAGLQVLLANGQPKWALIGNVDNLDPRMNAHFVTITIENHGKWFSLARYHDFDYTDRGPEALATFLELPAHQVFPISFDLSHVSEGNPKALVGEIEFEARERLTRAEIIAMAVP